jgi:hypothetical protein
MVHLLLKRGQSLIKVENLDSLERRLDDARKQPL